MDDDGRTELHNASQIGSTEVVLHLLTQGVNINNSDNDGWTALHFASIRSNAVAIILLNNGADVNAVDREGWSPIHVASFHDKKDILWTLIVNGADLSLLTLENKSVFDIAKEGGQYEMMELLHRAKAMSGAVKINRNQFALNSTHVDLVQLFQMQLCQAYDQSHRFLQNCTNLPANTLGVSRKRFLNKSSLSLDNLVPSKILFVMPNH